MTPGWQLPSDWKSTPVKHAVCLNSEVLPETTSPETEIEYVDISALEAGSAAELAAKPLTFADAPSRARRVLRSGDTIVSTVRTYLKAVATFPMVEGNLVASTGFAVLRPNGTLLPRFAYWAVLSETFVDAVVAHSEGVSYPAISPSVFGALHLPVPPLAEQQRIANFLDEQTARIDALITEKERLGKCLSELLTSHLERAFTGKDVAGPRWQTGSIFFPTLPEGWKASALKHLVESAITDGPHETPEFVPEGIPFVSAEAVKGGRLDFERKRGFISLELHQFYCKKVKPRRGDIFMVKSGNTTGAVAVVETDDEFSVWSPLAVIRADKRKVLPDFLFLALQTPYFQRSVQLYWSQGTQPNIGMAVLENLQVAIPPIRLQESILNQAAGLRERVVALSKHCDEHIDRLREYRSSLISAAVTGQLTFAQDSAALTKAA